jgi:hypothetical protein
MGFASSFDREAFASSSVEDWNTRSQSYNWNDVAKRKKCRVPRMWIFVRLLRVSSKKFSFPRVEYQGFAARREAVITKEKAMKRVLQNTTVPCSLLTDSNSCATALWQKAEEKYHMS